VPDPTPSHIPRASCGRSGSRELRAAAAALCTLALTTCDGEAPEAPRLNVLFVVLDTLRADRLETYGAPRATAPGLDHLAGRSVVFENAQSAAPLTVASLLTMVTGLYPAVHQVQGEPVPGRMSENVRTLTEILRERGYATAAFTEGGYAKGDFGLDQGFEVYPRWPGDAESNISNLHFPSRIGENLDRTLAWLRTPREQPFFLFFHTYEIHRPYWTLAEHVRTFRPGFDEVADHARVARAIEFWNTYRTTSAEDALALLLHLFQCPLTGLPQLEDPDGYAAAARALKLAPEDAVHNEALLELVRDLYDASIHYADAQLARLWKTLAETGHAEDTLIVVLSDHGEGLGEHGELEHSNKLFEEALRVPLLIHVPGQEFAPKRVPDLVQTVDLAPTVLELLGIRDRAAVFQGRSLVPLLRGAPSAARPSFSHARRTGPDQNPQFSVRQGRWRLIQEPAIHQRWLYDLEADPDESIDIAAKLPDVTRDLEALLTQQAARDERLRTLISTSPTLLDLDDETRREISGLGY